MSQLAERIAAVTQPFTLEAIWDEAYSDAKARLNPVNPYLADSKESDAYVRGYMAGVLARGFTAQGVA